MYSHIIFFAGELCTRLEFFSLFFCFLCTTLGIRSHTPEIGLNLAIYEGAHAFLHAPDYHAYYSTHISFFPFLAHSFMWYPHQPFCNHHHRHNPTCYCDLSKWIQWKQIHMSWSMQAAYRKMLWKDATKLLQESCGEDFFRKIPMTSYQFTLFSSRCFGRVTFHWTEIQK